MKNKASELFVPDGAILGPNGMPIMSSGPVVIGIDVYEATGGTDSVSAIAHIELLRKNREKAGTLVVAPGAVTEGLLIEVAIFNHEVYQGRELDENDRAAIAAATRKRMKRSRKAQDRAAP